jgi:hypothetical protein
MRAPVHAAAGRGFSPAVLGLIGLLSLAAAIPVSAQRGGGPPQGPPRAVAPIDLTGYWVSIVSMDWRWRMVTPAKGDYAGIPMNAASKTVADAWDPAKDEAAGQQCKSYGAPAIMSVPGRLHITWQDDSTLKVETDAGQQTRLLKFAAPGAAVAPAAKTTPSWQGTSVAQWQMSSPALPLMLRPQERAANVPAPPVVRGGTLHVVTNNLRAGYLRKNGVPYSANAVLTEYWDVTKVGSDTLLTVTQIIDDPTYLRTRRLIAYPFKKEANGDKWDPAPCSARW